MIVGTAGHVDHGKTSLVRMLTGVDTDRLAEEKSRGISIELGFAYSALSADGDDPIGFVDVPGHRRFVQTMIAGAAGIDVGLLVVAADDGPMPQTREHLDILAWLGVPSLIVALSKVDAVDDARRAAAEDEVRALLDPSAFADVPIVPVSIADPDSIERLAAELRACRDAKPKADARSGGRFRLAIDRAFVLQGIGLVVTGTAFAGRVTIDDRLLLLPSRLEARVRGIHAQNRPVDAARAGQRVALNLAGRGIEKQTVHRGDWIVAPDAAYETDRVDVALAIPLTIGEKGWRGVRFHAGAAAVDARLATLDGVLAQLAFERPLHVLAGDRFVLRDAGAEDDGSIAGGVVLDADVPARGRRSPARLAFLAVAAAGDARRTLADAVETSDKGVDLTRWNRTHGTDFDPDAVAARAVVGAGGVTLFAHSRWAALHARMLEALADEHRRAPDAVGPGRDRLRRMTAPALSAGTFGALIDAAKIAGALVQTGAWLHLPDHRVELTPEDDARFARARALLESAAEPNSPPRVRDIARALGDDEAAIRHLFVRLASRGIVYRVAHDHYFLPETVAALARTAAALAATDGVARAAPFRDRIGAGRKVAIQILEFFDRVGYTRRVGDDHRVIQPDLFES